MQTVDYLIVGAGIAGAGVAYRLAGHGDVLVVDMEEQAGFHTTGRSAAFYAETYGGPMLQPLTTASKEFLLNPPIGFTEAPLITPLGAITVFTETQKGRALAQFERDKKALPDIELLDGPALEARVPQLAEGKFAGGIVDMGCGALDVAALLQGFLKGAKKMGATFELGALFESAARQPDGMWRVTLGGHTLLARTIVNCAGAWGDEVAKACGIAPIGLQPKRRTLVTIPNPDGLVFDKNIPVIIDFDEAFYFKPEGLGYLLSPADETDSPACDAQPELEDVAYAVDHFEKATGTAVKAIEAKWAGLRTFAPDRAPVIGFDAAEDGFFWCVGQGGYGIQTAPAWSRLAASLLVGEGVPDDVARLLAANKVDAAQYSPARFGGL